MFAVHPLRVESVAWVAERKDLLSGLFFMLTLAAYLRYVRRPFSWGRYLLVIAMFALGLMAKPMLVTLPFVLLLLDYWPLGRIGGADSKDNSGADIPVCREKPRLDGNSGRQECLPHLIVEKIPLLLLAAVSCGVTSLAQQRAIIPVEMVPIHSRIVNALMSYVAYIEQFSIPRGWCCSIRILAKAFRCGRLSPLRQCWCAFHWRPCWRGGGCHTCSSAGFGTWACSCP